MKLINKLSRMLESNDLEMTDLAATIINKEKDRFIQFEFLNKDARRSYYRDVLAHEAWQLGVTHGKEILNGTKRENAPYADE